MVSCSIEMQFSPGDLDRSVQLLRSVVGPIQAKTGCQACTVAKDVTDDCQVRYNEMWDSKAAFERHVKSEEFRRVLVAMDMCRAEPRVTLGNLSGHRGLASLRRLREKQDGGAEGGEP